VQKSIRLRYGRVVSLPLLYTDVNRSVSVNRRAKLSVKLASKRSTESQLGV
jgi:hypothetical protein